MKEVDLLEPIKVFNELKEKHHESVVKYFDKLVTKSGVNVEENKSTCKNIHKLEKDIEDTKKESSKLGFLLFLFIFLIVLGAIGLIAGIVVLLKNTGIGVLILVLGVLLIVSGILLIVKVYKPKKALLLDKISKMKEKLQELMNLAKSQMAPLNALFEGSAPAKLFEQTCPLIQMDRYFDSKKYALMREKYDFWDNSEENSSTIDLQSGSILGNPFVIFKDFNMNMVPHTYTGTLSVSYYVGSGQNRHLTTEVLRASIIKDVPSYSTETYLVYGNEACQKLSFSRDPSKINSMDEKQIQNYVEKHEKDLDKLASKQLKTGGGYTPIGNPEFELFFGGLDRDNEIEFRMLFTALGQKNMMDLLKSKVGFGDDFTFRKIKGLNLIVSKHSQGDTLFVNINNFKGYEFEVMKNFFITFNDNYFKALYFDFAPLISLPLYQQTKTHEFIYKDVIKSNYSPFTHECVANKFNVSEFAHKLTKTDVILKTNFERKENEKDIVNVTAHSFDAKDRVTYVEVRAGNGSWHSVPVHWTEYIPLENSKSICINDLGVDNQAKFNSLGENNVVYVNGLVSNMSDSINVDINKLKDLMRKE